MAKSTTSRTTVRKAEKVKPFKGGNGVTITLGNLKLPTTTAIWSLPAVTTCPGAFAQGCALMNAGIASGHCYALKAEKLYKGVRECRNRNLDATKRADFAETMAQALADLTAKRTVTMVRIHESGDFYSQSYLDAWISVARLFPGITFYAYTKSIKLDFSARPSNLIVLLSDDRGIWRHEWNRFDRVFALDSTDADMDCPGDCRTCNACVTGPAVISIAKH